MMKETCVTERHLLCFGTIIHCFARYEVLMQEIMAAISGGDATSIRLLTADLRFTEKRDALFNLLRHRAVTADQVEQLRSYMRIPSAFIPLRSDIAHSAWTEGEPQGSIWPAWLSHGPRTAVKPLHDIGGDGTQFVADDQDKVTYSLDDLKEIGENLMRNYAAMEAYALGAGLIRSGAA
jgi:hypothetical protein